MEDARIVEEINLEISSVRRTKMSNRLQTKEKLKFHKVADFRDIELKSRAGLNKIKKFGSDKRIPIGFELIGCECGNKTEKRICEKCGLELRR